MNQKYIFNLSSPKGTEEGLTQRKMIILVMGLVVLSLVALTAYIKVSASEPVAVASPAQVDPADRKFFSDGYGANIGVSKIDPLANVDPADRKFFSPGYGAQTVISREGEAFPNIDPADRKFFSPGYGAQTKSANGSEAILPPIENEMGKQIPIWFLLK